MKKIYQILLLLLISKLSIAQATRETLQSGMKMYPANELIINEGYQCTDGWTIKKGDTLQIGKGTLPNHAFAYIYQAPTSFMAVSGSGNDRMNGQNSLKSGEASRAIVKRMQIIGTRKGGFTGIAVVGVGSVARYFIEIENAVENGEIIAPTQYQKSAAANPAPAGESLADRLKKWKDLLDSGAITQEEYDTQKKKLLGE